MTQIAQPTWPVHTGHQRKAAIEAAIARATGALGLFRPSLQHVIMGIEHVVGPESKDDVAAAYTNGKRCFYNNQFAALPIKEQMGVIIHEWLHCALSHTPRYAAIMRFAARRGTVWSHDVFNIAADLVINSWIITSNSSDDSIKIPEFGVLASKFKPEKFPALHALVDGRLDERTVAALTSEEVYKALMKDMADDMTTEQVAMLGQAGDMAPDDETSSGPGQDGDVTGAADRFRRMITQMAGDDPSGLLRRLADALPKPVVPWRHVLRKVAGDIIGLDRERTWSRRNKRSAPLGIVAAGYKPERVPRIVFILDTSGSMSEELMTELIAEVLGIARAYGAEVEVYAADTIVSSRHVVGPNDTPAKVLSMMPKGGGGTDFEPSVRHAERLGADVVVYGTDLYGDLDFKPRAPLVWLTRTKDVTPPYGRTIILPDEPDLAEAA